MMYQSWRKSSTSKQAESTPILPHQIVLWHIRTIPVTGVVVNVDESQQQATIKVRDLSGNISLQCVSCAEIEVRNV